MSPCYSDDHIIGHHTWSYLLAWRNFVQQRPQPSPKESGQIWFKNAQLLVDRRGQTELYMALNKGGVFKLFRNHQLVVTDTQFSALVQQRKKTKNAVGHLIDSQPTKLEIQNNEITIKGQLGWAKQTQMSPLKLIILRMVMLTVGRFFPNLIRKLLQKILITGKQNTGLEFQRSLRWENEELVVHDKLKVPSWENIKEVGIGADQTSIYVVMSRTFQWSQLQPWLDLTPTLKDLPTGDPLTIKRRY